MRSSDPLVLASKLRSCANLSEVRSLHSHLVTLGWDDDKFIGNHLVQMYGAFASLPEARAAFERLRWRNVFSWTILVTAYAQNRDLLNAGLAFVKMPEHNVVPWNAIMVGYFESGELSKARGLFDQIPEPDTVSWNSMISAYAEAGDLPEARSLFLTTPVKNVVSWTAMITAYAQTGLLDDAKSVFDEMPERNVVSWNSLMAAYAQAGEVQSSRDMFDRIPQRDLVSWNSLIPAYTRSGLLDEAKILFRSIPCRPDVMLLTSMLAGCAEVGLIDEAEKIFFAMQNRDAGSWNAMIAANGVVRDFNNAKLVFERMAGWNLRSWTSMFLAYAQMADVEETRKLFDQMPERDLVSWNALLTAYARSNEGSQALELFKQMIVEGVQPNGITFICVIDACSQTGDLSSGKLIDSEIGGSRGSVELGNCFISMYSKCGSVADARRHFASMRERDSVSWTSIITAEVQSGGDCRRALKLFDEMVLEGIDPHDVTFLGVLAACAYAALLRKGWMLWRAMVADWRIVPRAEHYAWAVNLLARSGRLVEAEELIEAMPFEPEYTTWGAVLGACGISGSVEGASKAAGWISTLRPGNSAPYVSLANICMSSIRNCSNL